MTLSRRLARISIVMSDPRTNMALRPDDPRADDALMAAWVGGDASSFEHLYARHQAALYRFIRRVLGPALAAHVDEVFQDTWMRVVRSREGWRADSAATFRTWLFTLANHRAIDVLRRSGREVSLDASGDDDAAPWEPEATAWQHWPAPPGDAPQGDELAFWRRAGERQHATELAGSQHADAHGRVSFGDRGCRGHFECAQRGSASERRGSPDGDRRGSRPPTAPR